MARSWTTDRLDRAARGALAVSSAAVLAVRVQAAVVHARLMSTGSGSLTAVDLAALAAVGLAALTLVCTSVVRHRRRAVHGGGPRGARGPLLPPTPAEVLLAGVVLWAAVHLQWTAVVATRTTRDPWDHDTTPLEDLLLVGVAIATVLAVRHRWRERRHRRGSAGPRADILRGRPRPGGASRTEGHLGA